MANANNPPINSFSDIDIEIIKVKSTKIKGKI